ncbi:glycosyltransferase family protein [Bosea sp. 2RAB26]|uniref:glycosyltransferase family protein n=1 Tax=Bosea sp. 2RAB26 TaxID=3237476 RepID=UPI003F8EF60D
MTPRVLIAVTHLLGSGHLVRAAHLARALGAAGFETVLVSGGAAPRSVPDGSFTFAQLPPVKVEGVDFRNLLDPEGRPVSQDYRALRRKMLCDLTAQHRPDVVITEHFPFGRRQLGDEFLGLISVAAAANPRALVLSSVRDVLVTPRADRIREAEARIAAHFDAVLVHGDRAFLPLERSWPVAPELARKLRYTGYLTGPEECAAPLEPGEIVVSGGGSAAGLPLFELAIATATLMGNRRRWRILGGQGIGAEEFADLEGKAPAHVCVERARPDFPGLLAGCALSISQAGYNTVLDLVRAGRPAIVVPFDAGNETEQAIRAEAMEHAGLARCLRLTGPDSLTPSRLEKAVTEMLGADAPPPLTIDRAGAETSVAIIAKLLAERA